MKAFKFKKKSKCRNFWKFPKSWKGHKRRTIAQWFSDFTSHFGTNEWWNFEKDLRAFGTNPK